MIHGGRDQRTLENALSLARCASDYYAKLNRGFASTHVSNVATAWAYYQNMHCTQIWVLSHDKNNRSRMRDETHLQSSGARNQLPELPSSRPTRHAVPLVDVHIPARQSKRITTLLPNRTYLRQFQILRLPGGKFDTANFPHVSVPPIIDNNSENFQNVTTTR